MTNVKITGTKKCDEVNWLDRCRWSISLLVVERVTWDSLEQMQTGNAKKRQTGG